MAYFQNFTSTYGNIEKMKDLFYGAIENPNIMGLSIATRADCLSDEVIDLLDDLNKKTFLIVELGLQSVNEMCIRDRYKRVATLIRKINFASLVRLKRSQREACLLYTSNT